MGSYKKSYLINRISRRNVSSFDLDGTKVNINPDHQSNYIDDKRKAMDIEQKYGKKGTGDVYVMESEVPKDTSERGTHRYVFSVPEMPWKRKNNENTE